MAHDSMETLDWSWDDNIETFIQSCPLLTKRAHRYSNRRLSVCARNGLDSVIVVEALIEHARNQNANKRHQITCKSVFTKII